MHRPAAAFPRGGPGLANGPALAYSRRVATPHAFADVLQGNSLHAARFHPSSLEAKAARGLAVLTCMDSRIDPLAVLGLAPGDAKILRNAGARVTEDVLRTVVLARYLLGVERFMVIAHTNCRMTSPSELQVHESMRAAGGPDTRSLSFLTTEHPEDAVRSDVQRVPSSPYLPGLVVGGFLYHLESGVLDQLC